MASNNEYNSDNSTSCESEDDSEYNYITNYVFESEMVGSASGNTSSKDQGAAGYQPYSNEPMADEEWLAEYYSEKQKDEERFRELERRCNDVEAVSSWYVIYSFVD